MPKLVKIMLTGIVLSAAIIGIVVVMTPLTDEAIPQNEASPQSSALVANKDLPPAQDQYPKLTSPTTLDLPKVRLVRETKALQEELREKLRG